MNANVFSIDCRLDRSMIIEASAGTGKTYNIQNLYLRYIVEMGIEIDHILVVTFTKAAAGELKDRLRGILKLAYSYLNHTQDDDFSRLDGFKQMLENHPEAQKRLAHALAHFDQAHISTIHGFCQEVLRTNAFECCTFFEHELRDDNDDFKREIILDYYREQFYSNVEFQHYFIKSQLSVKTFFEQVSSLLENADCLFETDLGESFVLGKNVVQYPLYEEMEPDVIGNTLFLNAVQSVYQRLETYKLTHGLLTYDDLLKRVHTFLTDPEKGPHLRDALKRQFKVVFIDEFQDTNQIQYEIFKTLHDSEHYLIFVGDPKQAIYGFRGGDIKTYIRARNEMIKFGAEIQSLEVNYRSDKQLVDAMNILFGEHPFPFGLSTEDIEYTKVKTLTESKEEENPLRCVYFESEKPIANSAVFDLAVKDCCLRIEQLLTSEKEMIFEDGRCRRIEAKDIAILVFQNKDAQRLKTALCKCGISAITFADQNIYQTTEAKELLSVLEAVISFSNPQKVYRAMLTSFLGYTLEDLTSHLAEKELEVMQENYMNLNGVWRTYNFQSMIARFKQLFEVDLKLASQLNASQKLAHFNALIDIVDHAICEGALSPEHTLEFLSKQIFHGKNEEQNIIPRESDDDAVQVMTYHKSKGLEFPIVFLPDFFKRNIKDSSEVYKHYKFYRENQHVLFISGDKTEQTAAKESSQIARLQEDLRLVYVCMTRAKNRCYFYWGNVKDKKNATYWLLGLREYANLDSLFPMKWKENKKTDTLQSILYDYLVSPITTEEIELTPVSSSLSFTPLNIDAFLLPAQHNNSFTSLTMSHQVRTSVLSEKKEDDEFETESTFEGGTHDIFSVLASNITGNAWHEIFEVIDFQAPVDPQVVESILTKYLLNPSKENQYVKITTQMVEQVLHKTLDHKQLKLSSISNRQRLSELEFYFPIRKRRSFNELFEILKDYAGTFGVEAPTFSDDFYDLLQGYFKGFIDLVFEYEGKFYIIDWKSNSLARRIENFSPERLRSVMGETWYFLQYLIYCVALMKYIRARTQLDFATAYERYFGGVFYLFLRGIRDEDQSGIFTERPPKDLIEKLEDFLS